MKSGVGLIAKERSEQITKHDWTLEHDRDHISDELVYAAMYALNPCNDTGREMGWDLFKDKIDSKTAIERYIVAGALIAAEIDRLLNLEEETDEE